MLEIFKKSSGVDSTTTALTPLNKIKFVYI